MTFSTEAQIALNRWITDHRKHPYMRRADQKSFTARFWMIEPQLATCLNNRRQRLFRENRPRKGNWRREKLNPFGEFAPV
jgi:hypothetical protein